MERLRHYYYFDERNDDFANDGIKGSPTPADYEYFPKNILYRTLKPIVYYGLERAIEDILRKILVIRRRGASLYAVICEIVVTFVEIVIMPKPFHSLSRGETYSPSPPCTVSGHSERSRQCTSREVSPSPADAL